MAKHRKHPKNRIRLGGPSSGLYRTHLRKAQEFAVPGELQELQCGAFSVPRGSIKLQFFGRRLHAVVVSFQSAGGEVHCFGARPRGLQVFSGGRIKRVQSKDGVVDLHER